METFDIFDSSLNTGLTELCNPKKPTVEPTKSKFFPCVHEYDQRVISNIDLNLKTGPWIAGGAALSWYNGESAKSGDIDIFCANQDQYDTVTKQLHETPEFNCYSMFTSENAVTYTMWDTKDGIIKAEPQKIQVIKRFFPTLDDMFNSFDISICKIATDGLMFYLGATTAADIKNKRFTMRRPINNHVGARRCIKYITYGYTPEDDVYEELASITGSIDFSTYQSGDYDNAF
jgi:hypothetical protein